MDLQKFISTDTRRKQLTLSTVKLQTRIKIKLVHHILDSNNRFQTPFSKDQQIIGKAQMSRLDLLILIRIFFFF